MKKEELAATFWLCLGALYLTYSLQYDAGEISNPAPGFFPRAIALLLIFLAGVVLFSSIRNRTKGENLGELFKNLGGNSLLVAVIYIVCVAAYAAIIKYIGFLIASILLVFCLCRIMGGRSWILNAVISISSSFVIYYTFWVLMRVPIPLGTLWGK